MILQDMLSPRLGQALRPNVWDVVALVLVIGAVVLIVYGGEQTTLPLSTLDTTTVSLDLANLLLYALRTTMRMLLAIICSTIFTFLYAALAAKSRRGADPAARHPAVGADPRLSHFHRRVLPEPVSRQRVRRRTRLRIRDLHQPGLEHDLQHVPVNAQRAEGCFPVCSRRWRGRPKTGMPICRFSPTVCNSKQTKYSTLANCFSC